jgi:uncharacterized protein (TIGR02001 family)
VRVFACGATLLMALTLATAPGLAADIWGGSVDLTNDYLVRGISRTSNDPALQLDMHYAPASGFMAGAFASNSRIDRNEPTDVELSGFIGFGWALGEDWHARVIASDYLYPWNQHGSRYNYDELTLDVAYQGWLRLSVEYSPNSPRFLPRPYSTLISETEKSAEISLQRQIWRKLSATAGIGYSFLNGPEAEGYAYWSVGGAYDLGSVSLVAAYVSTSGEAKYLFPNAAASKRATATLIWRF